MHKHIWVILLADAIGRYEKQEGQDRSSIVYCRGRIERCFVTGCQVTRLVPASAHLRPVIVEAA